MRNSVAFAISLLVTVLALGLAWLLDDGTQRIAGLPLLPALALFAFVVQWAVYVPSFLGQTEHYYDLAGSLTYASVILLAAVLGTPDARSWVIAALVLVWCGRLGSFLFARVKRSGKDGRFDDIKPHWGRFLMAWTFQGLWVFMTLLAALIAVTGPAAAGWDAWASVGLSVWAAGFAIEAVAETGAKPLVLIAGGLGKGQDFTPLADAVRGRVESAVLLGASREDLARTLGQVCQTRLADSIEQAVAIAAELATPAGAVLLAPACASQDQFRDYADRGDRFAEAVAQYAAKADR